MFRLNRTNLAANAVVELSRSRDLALDAMRAAAAELSTPPVSVIIFGSFARREADRHSDIEAVRAVTGNAVEILETGQAEAATKLASNQALWRDVARDGVVVHGATLDQLRNAVRA